MYIGASLQVVEDWTIVSRLLESNADSRVRGLGLLCCLGDNFTGLKTLRALLEAYRLGAGTLGSQDRMSQRAQLGPLGSHHDAILHCVKPGWEP